MEVYEIKISIVNYKMGNLKSVYNALQYLGVEPIIASSPSELKTEKIIIPGVGAFGEGMRNLEKFIPEIIDASTHLHILGICLGLQMLFDSSEESPREKGIGLIKGKVIKIKTNKKLPHIGWNKLEINKKTCPLFKDVSGGYVYFVHSYHAFPEEDVITATTNYGCKITASIWKNNIFGTQFHPEKSGAFGLKILKNFIEL